MKTDSQLQIDVVAELQYNECRESKHWPYRSTSRCPARPIAATPISRVPDGWITLTGFVDWDHQRQAAEAVIRGLMGVTGVSNPIALAHCTSGVQDVVDHLVVA